MLRDISNKREVVGTAICRDDSNNRSKRHFQPQCFELLDKENFFDNKFALTAN